MGNEHGFASVSISPMVKTVKNVCHSTMMHHGDEPHQKMYTNVNVSETVFISFISLYLTFVFDIMCCYSTITPTSNGLNRVFLFLTFRCIQFDVLRFVVQQELQVSLCVYAQIKLEI